MFGVTSLVDSVFGDQVVLDKSISDLKVNTGLTQNDFPF